MVMGYANVIRWAALMVVLALVLLGGAHVQEIPITSAAAYAEKIYLQTDAEVYTTDETIWFNTVVVSSQDLSPTALSGVLHVELVASDEHVIQRKRIKLTAGRGGGRWNCSSNGSSSI